MRRRHTQEIDTELDMTPMLDIVFIMLIFFIVTASFVKESGIEPEKASASTAQPIERANILIAIRDNGEVWMDKRPVEVAAVRANVIRMRAESPESKVVIIPDLDSKSGTMIEVWDQVRAAGVEPSIGTLKQE